MNANSEKVKAISLSQHNSTVHLASVHTLLLSARKLLTVFFKYILWDIQSPVMDEEMWNRYIWRGGPLAYENVLREQL